MDNPIPGVDDRLTQLIFLLNLSQTEAYSAPSSGTMLNPSGVHGGLLLGFVNTLIWGLVGYLDSNLLKLEGKSKSSFSFLTKAQLTQLLGSKADEPSNKCKQKNTCGNG